MPAVLRRGLSLLAVGLLGAACGESPPTSDGGVESRRLTILDPPGPDVGLSPGGERALRIRYTDRRGAAISGGKIQFAIFGDPRGSTLSGDTVYTNDAGEAEVQVRASAATCHFEVRVTAQAADTATFYVEVSDAGFGALSVRAAYTGSAEKEIALVRYLLYLDGGEGCRALSPAAPPLALRERAAPGLGEAVSFKALPMNVDHAILAIASDGKLRPRAVGCLEVPRQILKAGHEVMVLLPLADLPVGIIGRFALTSTLALPKPPAPGSRPLHDALRPFRDLTDCPRDPAQLLLDCLIDALEGTTPLDCVSGAAASPVVEAIREERGVLDGSGCRGALTSRGGSSLEEKLSAALQAGGAALRAQLPKLPDAAEAQLAHGFQLESELELIALDAAAGAAVSGHQLLAARFGTASASVVVPLAEVGLPGTLAFPVDVTLSEGSRLLIAEHNVTLRFGLLARLAVGRLVLAPAGLPETSSGLANALLGAVQGQGSSVGKGCQAASAIVCGAARLPADCLVSSCPSGAQALAAFLDGGFVAIAGNATDFTVKGTVTLIDADGDQLVEGLGTTENPGSWNAVLDLGGERVAATTASFVGKRVK